MNFYSAGKMTGLPLGIYLPESESSVLDVWAAGWDLVPGTS